jgi:hypothetical protein
MTIGAIDLLARRREMVGGNTRERLSPERAVAKLLTLRSRWIEAVTFDGRFSAIEKVIGAGCVSRYLNRDPNNERFGMFWMSHGRIGLEQSLASCAPRARLADHRMAAEIRSRTQRHRAVLARSETPLPRPSDLRRYRSSRPRCPQGYCRHEPRAANHPCGPICESLLRGGAAVRRCARPLRLPRPALGPGYHVHARTVGPSRWGAIWCRSRTS